MNIRKVILSFLTLCFISTGILFIYSSSSAIQICFFVCSLILGAIVHFRKPGSLKIILPVIVSGGIVGLVLYLLESVNYDNYVYSHIHVFPQHLAIFVGFMTGMYILTRTVKQPLIIRLSLLVIIALGFAGVTEATAKAIANLGFWLRSPQSIEDRAVADIYGNDLEFIYFIKDSTPENARIVIPPAYPGRRHTADIWIMSSFLYPRKITAYIPGMDLTKFDFVVITSEFDTGQKQGQTWPDFDIGSSGVVIYDWDNDIGVQIPGLGYNFNKISVMPVWGFISMNK